MLNHLRIPPFPPDFLDSLLALPQFDPVGHQSLKCLDVAAGILLALMAKIYPFLCGTSGHFAVVLAIKTALVRPASFTFYFFHRHLKVVGYGLQS